MVVQYSRVLIIYRIAVIGTRMVGEPVNALRWTTDEEQCDIAQHVDELDEGHVGCNFSC